MARLTVGNTYGGFIVRRMTYVNEVGAELYELEHIRSGAKLIYLGCDDDNKVFSVMFRTMPEDSTGVFHILEHSVLCGSDRYPVKEPFVDLLKGSMATFLNAFTFPDKTGYPVASCNDRDFANLMGVYLDAVFAPKVLEREEIFMQEGWHYEIEAPDAPMTYRGVVFNEMKGAYSSVDRRMSGSIQAALYPDTFYRFSSGGDPAHIPDLSYEQFIASYRKYYHPENSLMFLYGNMDVAERLEYIDREYLSKYERTGRKFDIPMQKPVSAMDVRGEYPISESDSEEKNSYISYSCVVGDWSEREKLLALDILISVLTSTNDSPLKKAVLESGMASDMSAYVYDGVAQPYVMFELRKTDADKKDAFLELLFSELERIAKDGVDREALRAEINQAEFALREGKRGGMPAGLLYNLDLLSSWLYGGDPEIYLEYEEALADIKAGVDSGYFEDLIRKCILENSHRAAVVLVPSRTLAESEAKAEADRIAAFRATLTDADIAALVEKNRRLVEFQKAADTPEAVATLPQLALSDVGDGVTALPCTVGEYRGRPMLMTEANTKKIAYVNYYFDISGLSPELIPYASLYAELLGDIATEKHTAAELDIAVKSKLGSFSTSAGEFTRADDIDRVIPFIGVRASILESGLPEALGLVGEMISSSVFEKEEIAKLVLQSKNMMQAAIARQGNSYAATRVRSYGSVGGAYDEVMGGISYYRFLSGICESIGRDFDAIKEKLTAVAREMTLENLTVGITGGASAAESFIAAAPEFGTGTGSGKHYTLEPAYRGNEAFVIPSAVNYVAKGFNCIKAGIPYDPKMGVLSRILRFDWLWNEVRVRGGAYGVSFGVSRSGDAVFSSYRDPSVGKTVGVYDGTVGYLRDFAAKNPDITKYIISTAAGYERPLTPRELGAAAQSNYFEGITDDMRRDAKRRVMETTPEDIGRFADLIGAVAADGRCTVVGCKEKIDAASDVFTVKEDI